jgi:hypothetical protein
MNDIKTTFNSHISKDKDFTVCGLKHINEQDIYSPQEVQGKLCSVVTIKDGIEIAEMICRNCNGI